MDMADMSLQHFLIRELQYVPLKDGVVSLEAILEFQSDPPRDIPDDEREDIANVEFTTDNYSHIRLRLDGNISFEIVKETVRRYYREAGYDITFDDDLEGKLLIEAVSGDDTVQVSCRIRETDVLDILVA